MVQKFANQLRLVVYPIIYKVLYIQDGGEWDIWTIQKYYAPGIYTASKANSQSTSALRPVDPGYLL